MVEHNEELIRSHTSLLATIDSRSKSNVKRLDTMEHLVTAIHELSINFTSLLGSVEQQGKDLATMVKTLESHEHKIDNLEEKMETKETVSSLQSRVEELNKLMQNKEEAARQKTISEYEDTKKFVVKTLIGAAVFVIGAVTIFGAIVLSALANNGTLPMP